MKRKIAKGLVLALTACQFLCGCGNAEKDLDSTSVFIRKDGSLKSAVYEPFDKNTYSSEELNAFITDAVSAYNLATVGEAAASDKDTKTPLSVIFKSLDYKDENAVLKLEYASCEDYLAFNEAEGNFTELASGTVGDAKDAGLDLSAYTLTNGNETIKASDLEIDSNIVLAKGSGKIVVGGKISYYTDGLTVTGDDTIELANENSTAVIIFK